MNALAELRQLADNDASGAPFGFDEFQRRQDLAQRRRRATTRIGLAAVALVALVPVVAVLTQPQVPNAALTAPALQAAADARSDGRPQVPALIDLEQFEVTSELEDHIAMLDAELSLARVRQVPADQLRQMEAAREQLNDSLQRVSYAHSLLNF